MPKDCQCRGCSTKGRGTHTETRTKDVHGDALKQKQGLPLQESQGPVVRADTSVVSLLFYYKFFLAIFTV